MSMKTKWKTVMRTLAKDLDRYLRARADVEGVGYELSPEFFSAYIKAGVASYFGVDADLAKGVLVQDRQEPWPGFFETWLKSNTEADSSRQKSSDQLRSMLSWQPTAVPVQTGKRKPADVNAIQGELAKEHE